MSETVLVVGVGAVAGIGAAVARKFAGAGYHVVVSGRTREKLETVVFAGSRNRWFGRLHRR
jgi:NADP-dependent 3-hydroxy acid dehydrogenase YdfG